MRGVRPLEDERWKQLEAALDGQPRVRLAPLPTAITPAVRLGRELGGVELYLKREDRFAVGLGGNKARQCEYRLGPGVAAGADTLITGGTVEVNNFACQAATAARVLGWDAHLVFMGRPNTCGAPRQGNRLLEWLMGVNVHHTDVGLADLPPVLERLADVLRERGRKPFVTGPSDHHVGALAYAACVVELGRQCADMKLEVDRVVVASGGPTVAGLWLGAAYLGLTTEFLAVNPGYYGVPGVPHDTTAQVRHIAERAAALLGLEVPWEQARVELVTADGTNGRQERITRRVRQAARAEAVFVDPVYGAVALEELASRIAAGRVQRGERILFVHTGGIPSLFGWRGWADGEQELTGGATCDEG